MIGKKGAEVAWNQIFILAIVLIVLLAVVFAFNVQFKAWFSQLTGIGKSIDVSTIDLSILTPGEKAKLERESPESRKVLCQAEFDAAKKTYDGGDYKSAIEKYKKFLEETLVKLGSDCPSGLNDIAKKGLEEAEFRIGETLSGKAKVDSYNNFINKYKDSEFIAEAYFKLGTAYLSVDDKTKAKEHYKIAAEKDPALSVRVDEALGLMQLDVKGIKADFSKSWGYAKGYFESRNRYKTLLELSKAEYSVDLIKKVLESEELSHFREFQIKVYKEFVLFDRIVSIFNEVKKEKGKVDSIKQQIGKDFIRVVKLNVGDVTPLYGDTGIVLIDEDGEICVSYKGRILKDYACITLTATDSNAIRVVQDYPFVSLKWLSSGVDEDDNAFYVAIEARVAYWYRDESNEKKIVLKEDNKVRIFEGVDLWVKYDGDWVHYEKERGSVADCKLRDWPTSSEPLSEPRICQNLPSIAAYHEKYVDYKDGWVDDTEEVTVKFVYTP